MRIASGYHPHESVLAKQNRTIASGRSDPRRKLRQVIYTSIVGNFDRLLAPAVVEPQLDYVAFCGEADQQIPPPWQRRPLLRRERNARMTARWHKFHPHLIFPNHDLSLYIDANVRMNAPVSELIDQMSSMSPIALFRHPERDCAYDEAEIVKRYRLDDGSIVDAQMAYYRALGYPAKSGLHVSTVQIRRHNDPRLAAFLDNWWQQVKVFSHRDQLSLDFMLMRGGIAAATIPGSIDENAWFTVGPHRDYRVDFARDYCAGACDALDWLRKSMIALADRDTARHPTLPKLKEAIWWHATEPLRGAKRLLRRWLWRIHRGW
jgi:hypothetical protein